MDEYLNELLTENDADVLVCGHTHLPYIKRILTGYIVNSGSTGKPKHGNPNVTYVTIEIDGAKVPKKRRSWKTRAVMRKLRGFRLPAEFAKIIRTGCA